jgi:transcriptional regulator NrdR family protein
MNPLESLKVKLRIKPVVEEHEKVAVVVPVPTAPEKVKISKVTIVDERGTDTGFNRETLFTKLQERKLNKTVVKPTVKLTAVQEEQEKEEPQKKKAKKIAKKILFKLQE